MEGAYIYIHVCITQKNQCVVSNAAVSNNSQHTRMKKFLTVLPYPDQISNCSMLIVLYSTTLQTF